MIEKLEKTKVEIDKKIQGEAYKVYEIGDKLNEIIDYINEKEDLSWLDDYYKQWQKEEKSKCNGSEEFAKELRKIKKIGYDKSHYQEINKLIQKYERDNKA